jgi:hypothetical protein
MLGPWIDERHVLAHLHHMGAGIPADGTRFDDSYLPTIVCTENLIRVDDLMESPKLAE